MIILPDRNIPKYNVLMPYKKELWSSSQSIVYNPGAPSDIIYIVNARLDDGYVIWRGEFLDREDFDAFLFSLNRGTLPYERELWNLSYPNWSPYIGENLKYDFLTRTFLTTPINTNLSYTLPIDWSSNNTIDIIGSGGGGGSTNVPASITTNRLAQGGQGGSFGRASKITSIFPGDVIPYRIGGGGIGGEDTNLIVSGSQGLLGSQSGGSGGNTFFSNFIIISGGLGGSASTGTSINSLANTNPAFFIGSGVGSTLSYRGGGSFNLNSSAQQSGGGGAAGPNGTGGRGTNTGTSRGGTGNGGTVTGSGTTGTFYSVSLSIGPGSGATSNSGFAGRYGGGGGGRGAATAGAASNGSQGLIVVDYEPPVNKAFRYFGRPMSGL